MQLFTSFITASAVISVVSAAIYNVTVGNNNQVVYSPQFLTGVQSGDIIGFKFVSKSHSVTQSTFAQPCVKLANGIDSGLISSTNTPEWSTTIDDVSAPLWFHCTPHCSLGMVFAVNPTADNTFDTFSAAAKGITLSSSATLSSATATSSVSGSSASSALSQVSAGKVALWLSTLGVVVGLAL
ncbi:hypothetical protein BYT27DRAFT_7202765 [Phlegmacium glaucopus]|nr:hypothetical protein BYT27DRAFT_7202765 [Phlegmacium glaucopus]